MLRIKDKYMITLIKKAQEGDRQAFSDLYAHSYERVYTQALAILKNKQNAEDVTQDIFIKLLDALPSLQSPEQYNFWLHRITYHFCINFIRKSSKFADPVEEFDSFPDPNETSDPLVDCVKQERQALILQSLLDLPIKYRTVLLLKYYEEESIKSIALIMDCSEGTVKSRLHNGRKLLKKSLKSKKITVGLLGVLPISSAFDTLSQTVPKPNIDASVQSTLSPRVPSDPLDMVLDMTPPKASSRSIAQTVHHLLIGGLAVTLMIGAVHFGTQITKDSPDSPPVIGSITLPDGYVQTLSLVIPVQNSTSINRVYLTSDTGEIIEAAPLSETAYAATIAENGHYTLIVSSSIYPPVTTDLSISHIDNQAPLLSDYYWQDNSLTISLSDSQSGIDYGSIYAKTSDNVRLIPSQIDSESGHVVFDMPLSDATVYFKDIALNNGSLSIISSQKEIP